MKKLKPTATFHVGRVHTRLPLRTLGGGVLHAALRHGWIRGRNLPTSEAALRKAAFAALRLRARN